MLQQGNTIHASLVISQTVINQPHTELFTRRGDPNCGDGVGSMSGMMSSPLSRVREHVSSDNAMLRDEVLRLKADRARLERALSEVQELAREDAERQSEQLAANNLLRSEVARLENELANQQASSAEASAFAVAAAVLRTREERARAQDGAIQEAVAVAVHEAVSKAREEVWAVARQTREAEVREAEAAFIARVADLERELRDAREEVLRCSSMFSNQLCEVASSIVVQERGPPAASRRAGWLVGARF